jgi:hypothetical protein
MLIRRLIACLASVAAGGAVLAPAGFGAPPPTASLPVTCPGTFQVLHNDHVGKLSLPAGPYVIAVSGKLSCSQASSLFTAFLNAWTGRLPDGWVISGSGFRKGSTSFTVTRTHNKPPVPPPAPPSRTCPGTFSVVNNTLVDRTAFRKGNYVISLLKASSVFTCQDASRAFALFLDRYYGKPLPSPLSLNSSKKVFAMKNGLGFQTTPAVTGLGGARNPTAGGGVTQGTLCRATYTVASRSARIDNFVLPEGKYSVWTIGQLSCGQAIRDIRRAVALRTSLPKGWKRNVRNSLITVGHKKGFRIKLKS